MALLKDYLAFITTLSELANLAHSKLKSVSETLEGLEPNSVSDYPLLVEIADRNVTITEMLTEVKLQAAYKWALISLSSLTNKAALNNSTMVSGGRYHITNGSIRIYLPIVPSEGDVVSLVLSRSFTNDGQSIGVEGLGVDRDILLDDTFHGKAFTFHGGAWLCLENPWDSYEMYASGKNSRGGFRITPDTIEQMVEVRPGDVSPWPTAWPDEYGITSSIISRQSRDTANELGYTIDPGNSLSYRPDLVGASVIPTGNIADIAKWKLPTTLEGSEGAFSVVAICSEEDYSETDGLVTVTEFNKGVRLFTVDPTGTYTPLTLVAPEPYTLSSMSSVAAGSGFMFFLESGWDPSDTGAGKTASFLRYGSMDFDTPENSLSALTPISTVSSYCHKMDAISLDTTESHALLGVSANERGIIGTPGSNLGAQVFVVSEASGHTLVETLKNTVNTTGVKCFQHSGFGWAWFTEEGSNNTDLVRINLTDFSTVVFQIALGSDNLQGFESPEIFFYEGNPYLLAMSIGDRTKSEAIRITIAETGIVSHTPISFNNRVSMVLSSTDSIRHLYHGENDYLVFAEMETGIKAARISGTTDSLQLTFGEEIYYPYVNVVEPMKISGNTLLGVGVNSRVSIASVIDTRNGNTELVAFSDRLAKLDALITGVRNSTHLSPTEPE